MIPLLGKQDPFPPVESALENHGGLLALGGGLSADRILTAYRSGIFPWGTIEGQPVWHSPDPRMVLFPEKFHLSHSLQKTLRKLDYQVSTNQDFLSVIRACGQTPRPGQDGTWISPEITTAYHNLNELGWCHSVEVRKGEKLVGGLYGLLIGRAFFGESMFSHQSDASKIAMAHLCRLLIELGVEMIDCQMHTSHLASLGGEEISRKSFIERLAVLIPQAGAASTLMPRHLGSDTLKYAW